MAVIDFWCIIPVLKANLLLLPTGEVESPVSFYEMHRPRKDYFYAGDRLLCDLLLPQFKQGPRPAGVYPLRRTSFDHS